MLEIREIMRRKKAVNQACFETKHDGEMMGSAKEEEKVRCD
jgi:hypothetical protein